MTSPSPSPSPPVIGVTGAPASGKSTVCRLMAAAGCDVIDVDALGHRALERDGVRDAVVREFGACVLGPDGRLDRAALGRLAFADAAVVRRLEGLVHPIVRRWIHAELERGREPSVRAVVIDCALLFESGLDALCDHTVWVDAPRAVRADRARADRGWSDEELARRESFQLPAEEKRTRAERVLANDRDPGDLEDRVLAFLDAIAPQPSPGPRTRAAGKEA